MKKLTILLAAFIFASPAFAEEVKVEPAKAVEAAATDEAKKAAEPVAEEAKKAPEAAVEEAKKAAEPVAEEAKKDNKAATAKKAKHGAKKHKKAAYTVVPEKKYTVVPVK